MQDMEDTEFENNDVLLKLAEAVVRERVAGDNLEKVAIIPAGADPSGGMGGGGAPGGAPPAAPGGGAPPPAAPMAGGAAPDPSGGALDPAIMMAIQQAVQQMGGGMAGGAAGGKAGGKKAEQQITDTKLWTILHIVVKIAENLGIQLDPGVVVGPPPDPMAMSAAQQDMSGAMGTAAPMQDPSQAQAGGAPGGGMPPIQPASPGQGPIGGMAAPSPGGMKSAADNLMTLLYGEEKVAVHRDPLIDAIGEEFQLAPSARIQEEDGVEDMIARGRSILSL